MLSAADVRLLAQTGRVHASPKYHASNHGFPFQYIVGLLQACRAVKPDLRTDVIGNLRHPNGFIAYANSPLGFSMRIDVDVLEELDGPRIFVVTAFRVKP